MLVNTSLIDYKYKKEFPWSLIIEIDIKGLTQSYKLPTESEGIILNLFEAITKECGRDHRRK